MMGFDGQGIGFGKKLFGSGKSYEQKIFGDWKLDQFPRDLGRGARALVGNGQASEGGCTVGYGRAGRGRCVLI